MLDRLRVDRRDHHRSRLRSLDVGCGAGFVVWLLGSQFQLESFGCDVSRVGVEKARARIGGDPQRVRLVEGARLPFDDAEFDLVTCFDVLEHLDEEDLPPLRDELRRVRAARGLTIATVSLRKAHSLDHHGENLHRTVKPVQWWIDLFQPDETFIHHGSQQATLWFGPTT